MINTMNKTLFIIAGLAAITSCSEGSQVEDHRNDEVRSTIAAGSQTEEELEKELAELRKEEEAKLKREKETMTSMSFDKRYHDFGNVKQEAENTTTFIVTNTGDKPLIIEDVAASCGCTTPEKPTEPILPGKSDKITVTFKSKPGQVNEQVKTVTVTANTSPKVEKLEIRAFVME